MDEAEGVAKRALRYAEWLAAVEAEPYRYDFYQAMRRIAALHPDLPLLGEALRPPDEPIRVAQPAELDFAPAPVHGVVRRDGQPPRLLQRMFGLLGPNGALPLHLTEYARERAIHHADPTFQRFLDTFTHRFALLFFRAWAEAQPAVSLDRRGNKAYFNRLGSLVGVGLPSLQDRDDLPDASKVYFAGRLARQTRDAEGLLSWIRGEFDVAARIEQWCGHWMPLMKAERSRLGRREGALLGRGAVIGGSVWDVQHKFRITLGPLSLSAYQRFLPGGGDLARLQSLVRHWVGIEFAWDVRLILARGEIPRFELGSLPFAGSAEVSQPRAPEGLHEAELVAVQRLSDEGGDRVGLVFRICRGAGQGIEFTEALAPNAATHGRLGEIVRALAAGPVAEGATDAVVIDAGEPADEGLGVGLTPSDRTLDEGAEGSDAKAPDAAASDAAATSDDIGFGGDRGDPADRGDGAGPAGSTEGAEGAEGAEPADHGGRSHGKRDVADAGSDGTRIGASLAVAHRLIGRRCSIALRHQRGADGVLRTAIGARTGLGYSIWLGRYRRETDADDLRLDVERPHAGT